MSGDTFTIPDEIADDVARAVEILRDGGCTAVFLFGSAVHGTLTEESDIDIAVEGCPQGEFFHLYEKLFYHLDRLVDLVSLDWDDPFVQFLQSKGELRRVG